MDVNTWVAIGAAAAAVISAGVAIWQARWGAASAKAAREQVEEMRLANERAERHRQEDREEASSELEVFVEAPLDLRPTRTYGTFKIVVTVRNRSTTRNAIFDHAFIQSLHPDGSVASTDVRLDWPQGVLLPPRDQRRWTIDPGEFVGVLDWHEEVGDERANVRFIIYACSTPPFVDERECWPSALFGIEA